MTRQEGNPRTFKEMCAVVTEASKKDIGRCYNFIVKELEQVCSSLPWQPLLPPKSGTSCSVRRPSRQT